MATHSSILAWKIPWTEEPGGLQFMGPQRVGHDFEILCLLLENESESEVALSCPTLYDPIDCSLPGSSVHGIFQAIVLDLLGT